MYETKPGRYDEIPEGMKRYINNYGCHFNKKLCDEVVSKMYYVDGNEQEKEIKPYSKEKVDRLLDGYGIRLKKGKMYDAVYVANMCAFDFLSRSVPDEKHLAMFIKDVIDDPDAIEGHIFNRWYADSMFMDNPVDWDDMI